MKRLVIALALALLTVSATAQLWLPILSGSHPVAATTYTETFDEQQFGNHITSNVIDGTDYYNHGAYMIDGRFK